MKLLIDVGNSRLKWACWDGRALTQGGTELHGRRPDTVLERLPPIDADAIWIASVAGAEADARIERVLRQRRSLTPRFAHAQAEALGLRNAYADPARLGVDRWLVLLAAWSQTPRPLIAVDAGTALTVDAVDGEGWHLGGLIAPGLHTAQAAVLGATRFDRGETDADFLSGFGRDTASCVRQGALFACLGAIDRAARSAGEAPLRFITGGDAEQLLPHLGQGWQHRPQLVLEGLALLADADTR